MSRCVTRVSKRALSFPRVSGDEPVESTLKRVVPSFSPRERG